MKGLADEPNYSVALLEGATALSDVVENHIYEQTLVSTVKRHSLYIKILAHCEVLLLYSVLKLCPWK